MDEIARIGDNVGSMDLKGASVAFEGEEQPDSWPTNPDLVEVGGRWGVSPEMLLKN